MLLDMAIGLASDMLAQRMPYTARMLGGMQRENPQPKTKRTKKIPDEVKVSPGVYYTPPTKRR